MAQLSKDILLNQVSSSTYVSSIPLARVGKYNSFGGHVDTNTKGLGGKQCFNQPLREENFYDLFQYRKAASNEIEERFQAVRYIHFIRQG